MVNKNIKNAIANLKSVNPQANFTLDISELAHGLKITAAVNSSGAPVSSVSRYIPFTDSKFSSDEINSVSDDALLYAISLCGVEIDDPIPASVATDEATPSVPVAPVPDAHIDVDVVPDAPIETQPVDIPNEPDVEVPAAVEQDVAPAKKTRGRRKAVQKTPVPEEPAAEEVPALAGADKLDEPVAEPVSLPFSKDKDDKIPLIVESPDKPDISFGYAPEAPEASLDEASDEDDTPLGRAYRTPLTLQNKKKAKSMSQFAKYFNMPLGEILECSPYTIKLLAKLNNRTDSEPAFPAEVTAAAALICESAF